MIQSPIENYYITVKFDDVNIEVNTEIHQKVLFRVSFRELHIDTLKNAIWLSMAYDEKGLYRISDSALRLLLTPQLLNMTH